MTAVAIEVLASALPDHDITLTPRPDGKFLLTVAKGGATQLCRAVDRRTVVDQNELRALAHELERDQKLVSGEISWKGTGARWVRRQLPTFTGAPVSPTAAKMMWTRRNLDHRQRPTA